MTKTIISTPLAPAAIGAYSQAVRVQNTVYLSGQIPLDPITMTLVEGGIDAEIRQVFNNLKDIVKLNVFLTDLSHFQRLNDIMAEYFTPPYPARAAIGVQSLPRGASVEMDGILVLEG